MPEAAVRLRVVAVFMLGCASASVAASGRAIAAPRAGVGPLCRAGDLAGAIIDIQGAAGSQFGRLILVNTSSRTCHTKGFIGGRFIGADGRPMATHVTRDHSTPARTVVVKPGAAAALELRWSVVSSGGRSCARARWLRVTPPDDTSTLRVYFGHLLCRGRVEVRALTDPTQVGG
jgi:hypothetical protein